MAIQEEIKMPICQISCLLLMLIFVIPKAQSLRITSIEVPPAVMNSSQVTLICNYDLQGDQLYSVKWYKNYVEFYRFQPSEQAPTTTSAPRAATFGSSGSVLASADNQAHSKHEFELAGINLNLSSSNSTHVYLRQTNLASEGTYKCEVSADSPSFATISSERQMKVYVLPKQKLSIVDNSLPTISLSQQQLALTMKQTNAASGGGGGGILELPTYNMNDLLNLTCISGPSRPAAKLSWLLNDLPIPSSSKWLTTPAIQQQQQSTTYSSKSLNQQEREQQLVESRLIIAFRIQSNHLATKTPGERQFQPIKLRCVARLSVEFVSETSIVVSGGKTTLLKKRQQQQQQSSSSASLLSSSSLPTPSSLQLGGQRVDFSSASSTSLPRGVQSTLVGDSYSAYRWPRPLSGSHRALATPSRRVPTMGDSFVDAWITSPVTLLPLAAVTTSAGGGQEQDTPATNGLTELTANGEFLPSSSVPARSVRPARQHHVVVWTERQMRDQAEHIDRLLRSARSNQLDTPLIEAKTHLESQAAPRAPIENDQSDNHRQHQRDENRDDDGTVASSTPGYYEQPDSTEADRGGPGETASWNEGSVEASTLQPPSLSLLDTRSAAGTSQDYELNDLVQFTCNSRVAPAEREVNKAVHLKWFINNQVIANQHVNAFDGSKFYYAREQHYLPETALPTTRQSASSRQRQLPYHHYNHHQSLPSLMEDSPQPSDLINDNSDHLAATRNSSSLVDDRSTDQNDTSTASSGFSFEQKSLSLLIEFTPSLFQSKELNLKCKTFVEQPLIEYDSQLVASVALNPFIQVDSTIRHQRPGIQTHLNRNNQNQQQQQQSRQHGHLYTGNHRNRNRLMHLQQSSSSASSSNQLRSPFLSSSFSYASLTVLFLIGSLLSLLTNQMLVINTKLTTFYI